MDRFERLRNRLKRTLRHRCDIYVFEDEEKGSLTKNVKVLKHKGIACQLYQKSMKPSEDAGGVSEFKTEAKLLICDEIEIAPGSEFDVFVTMGGLTQTKRYACASDPFVYETHMEIALIRKGRA